MPEKAYVETDEAPGNAPIWRRGPFGRRDGEFTGPLAASVDVSIDPKDVTTTPPETSRMPNIRSALARFWRMIDVHKITRLKMSGLVMVLIWTLDRGCDRVVVSSAHTVSADALDQGPEGNELSLS